MRDILIFNKSLKLWSLIKDTQLTRCTKRIILIKIKIIFGAGILYELYYLS